MKTGQRMPAAGVDTRNLGQLLVNTGSAGMWQQAQVQLTNKLRLDPHNRQALESLAQIYRQQGDLTEAAAAYRRISAADPSDSTPDYLAAVLSGLPLPVTKPVSLPWPAPFVLVRDFLPVGLRNRILEVAVAQRAEFKALKVYHTGNRQGGSHNPDRRQQLGMPASAEIRDIIHSGLVRNLPQILPRLQIVPFQFALGRLSMTLSHDGHFGKTHVDDYDGDLQVAVLYYFHRQPKSFEGGDLLLYDTNFEERTFHPAKFTRIRHEDNVLLLFPCKYFHQITKVQCASDRFEDGRFAVTGFLRRNVIASMK